MDEYCPHFFPLTFSEKSPWELQVEHSTFYPNPVSHIDKTGNLCKSKGYVQVLYSLADS
jgi:hypothetical protein